MARTSSSFFFAAALIASLALPLGGCANKNKGAAGGQDGDTVTGTALPDRQEGVSFMSSNVDRHRFSPIYFEFDSYQVRPEDRGRIREIADFMRGASNTIIIAGF